MNKWLKLVVISLIIGSLLTAASYSVKSTYVPYIPTEGEPGFDPGYDPFPSRRRGWPTAYYDSKSGYEPGSVILNSFILSIFLFIVGTATLSIRKRK